MSGLLLFAKLAAKARFIMRQIQHRITLILEVDGFVSEELVIKVVILRGLLRQSSSNLESICVQIHDVHGNVLHTVAIYHLVN